MTKGIRLLARVWAVASIVLILGFVIGEGFHPSAVKPAEWLGLFFFPLGICAGMIVAWWKESLGGCITVGSLIVFYLLHLITAGAFPKGIAWLLFAAPGFLFLLSWQRHRPAASTRV
jgi:hypothetical protein